MGERDRSPSARSRTSRSRDRFPSGSASPSGSAYDSAVRFLGPRPRSILEIRRHLLKKRFDERESAAAIERLREQGYADDRAFARYWLDQRGRFRPKGAFGLRSELRAKGVDLVIVEEVLGEGERDETAAARAALRPKLARWSGLEPLERKAKVQALLRQRGFSFDVIDEVLSSLDA